MRAARTGVPLLVALALGLAGCTVGGTSADLSPSPPGASTTPALTSVPTPSPLTLAEKVRANRSSLTFTPFVPSYIPDTFEARVGTRGGPRDPASGSEAVLLEIEFRAVATPWRAEVSILQGPAGCCLDSARPRATSNVDIRDSIRGQLIPVQPDYGGPIVWWVEQGTYVAVSSPRVATTELLRIARSMTPVR